MYNFFLPFRLTPAYALILGFVATLWERMGSGPDWAYVQESAKACREKWWTHLLYINNYEVFNPNLNVIKKIIIILKEILFKGENYYFSA